MLKPELGDEYYVDAPPPYEDSPPEPPDEDSSREGDLIQETAEKEDKELNMQKLNRQKSNGLGQEYNVYEKGYPILKSGIITGPNKLKTLYELHPINNSIRKNVLVLYKDSAPVIEQGSSLTNPNPAQTVATMTMNFGLSKTECKIELNDGKIIPFNTTSQLKAQFEFMNPQGTTTYIWKLNGVFSLKHACINKETGEEIANLRRIYAKRKTAQILIWPCCPESHEFMLAIALVYNRWIQVYNDTRTVIM